MLQRAIPILLAVSITSCASCSKRTPNGVCAIYGERNRPTTSALEQAEQRVINHWSEVLGVTKDRIRQVLSDSFVEFVDEPIIILGTTQVRGYTLGRQYSKIAYGQDGRDVPGVYAHELSHQVLATLEPHLSPAQHHALFCITGFEHASCRL